MGKQSRQVEPSNNTLKTWSARGALLALVAFLPLLALAEANELKADAPVPTGGGSATAPVVNVITLGTSKERLDSYLGAPLLSSTIDCLGRAFFTYADGTKILLVDGRVISAAPGGLAVGIPGQGYIIEHKSRKVFFEQAALPGVYPPGPLGDLKRQVEACFHFAPPNRIVPGPPPPHPPEQDLVPLKRIRLF